MRRLAVALAPFLAASLLPPQAVGAPPTSPYVVVLKDSVPNAAAVADDQGARLGCQPGAVYGAALLLGSLGP